MTVKEWHGTDQELLRLRAAVEGNCACAARVDRPQPPCAAHAMLVSQAVLDHLLFVYRARRVFLAREFALAA